MEEIIKSKNATKYTITTDAGSFEISFQGNGDLYLRVSGVKSSCKEDQVFRIDKENKYLYECFNKLYENIMKCSSLVGPLMKQVLEDRAPISEGIIDWASDDFVQEEASHLLIAKVDEEEAYNLTFKKSTSEDRRNTYNVRIANSGSRYQPFNNYFMELYGDLKEYKIEDHRQVDMDEYLAVLTRGNRMRTRILVGQESRKN